MCKQTAFFLASNPESTSCSLCLSAGNNEVWCVNRRKIIKKEIISQERYIQFISLTKTFHSINLDAGSYNEAILNTASWECWRCLRIALYCLEQGIRYGLQHLLWDFPLWWKIMFSHQILSRNTSGQSSSSLVNGPNIIWWCWLNNEARKAEYPLRMKADKGHGQHAYAQTAVDFVQI